MRSLTGGDWQHRDGQLANTTIAAGAGQDDRDGHVEGRPQQLHSHRRLVFIITRELAARMI